MRLYPSRLDGLVVLEFGAGLGKEAQEVRVGDRAKGLARPILFPSRTGKD